MVIAGLVVAYILIVSLFLRFGKFSADLDERMSEMEYEKQQDIHQGDC